MSKQTRARALSEAGGSEASDGSSLVTSTNRARPHGATGVRGECTHREPIDRLADRATGVGRASVAEPHVNQAVVGGGEAVRGPRGRAGPWGGAGYRLHSASPRPRSRDRGEQEGGVGEVEATGGAPTGPRRGGRGRSEQHSRSSVAGKVLPGHAATGGLDQSPEVARARRTSETDSPAATSCRARRASAPPRPREAAVCAVRGEFGGVRDRVVRDKAGQRRQRARGVRRWPRSLGAAALSSARDDGQPGEDQCCCSRGSNDPPRVRNRPRSRRERHRPKCRVTAIEASPDPSHAQVAIGNVLPRPTPRSNPAATPGHTARRAGPRRGMATATVATGPATHVKRRRRQGRGRDHAQDSASASATRPAPSCALFCTMVGTGQHGSEVPGAVSGRRSFQIVHRHR